MGILGWWYGAGWKQRAAMVKGRLAGLLDYFSLGLLLKTLFSPFRQISAGKVNGSLNVQMHAFFDRLLSRFIGMMIRLVMVAVGVVAIIVYSVFGLVALVVWAVVPLLPLAGIIFFSMGWMPWTQ